MIAALLAIFGIVQLPATTLVLTLEDSDACQGGHIAVIEADKSIPLCWADVGDEILVWEEGDAVLAVIPESLVVK